MHSDYSNSSTINFDIKDVKNGLYSCSVKNQQFNNYTEKFAAMHLRAKTTKTEKEKTSEGETADSFPTITIIIISVISIFVIILIITIIVFYFRQKKRKLSRYNTFLFTNGQVNLLNPELSLEEQAELLPYDPRWEFPKDRLKLGRVLGHGAFGRVVKAEAIGLSKDVPFTTVAVKMLKERDDESQHKALMAELKILIHLGKHVNILNLLGAVTKNLYKGELMVMVEYCYHGNLRNYLLKRREKFINQTDPITGKINLDISNSISQLPNPTQLKYEEYTKAIALGINNPIYNYSSTGGLISSSTVSSQGEISSDMTEVSNISCEENSNSTGTTKHSESGYSSTGESVHAHINSSIRDENRYSGIISTADLLCYSFQCAQGMSYLSSRKLIHRDLAARNILLAEGNIIKIADFGLAKDLYKYSKYVKKADGPLPIKWMAIESIEDRIFTTKSDVWSFGILLWEIFTLGGNPYPGFEMNEQFFKRLKGGYRMEKPEYAPLNVYQIMVDCWHKNPKERPEFNILSDRIGFTLQESVKQYYLDLNNPYKEENQNLKSLENYLTMTNSQADYLNMESNQSGYVNTSDTSCNNQPFSSGALQGKEYANAEVFNIINTTNQEVLESEHNPNDTAASNVLKNEEVTAYAKIAPQKKNVEDKPDIETTVNNQSEYLTLL